MLPCKLFNNATLRTATICCHKLWNSYILLGSVTLGNDRLELLWHIPVTRGWHGEVLALCCTLLCSTVLCSTVLWQTVMYCTVLPASAIHNNLETATNCRSTADNTVSSPLVLDYTFHTWQTSSHKLIGWANSIFLLAFLGYKIAMQCWHVVLPHVHLL